MNKVEQAICRIREKQLSSNDVVTHGVGCVVRNEKLATSLGWKCPNLIVTSVHVLTPEQLASDRIYFAEFFFFEKKGYEVFELKPAAEFCRVLNGRNFEDDEEPQQASEQLTVISVEPLDKRGFLKRMVKKSSLQNARPIDCFDFENFESELSCEGIFCNVIREFGSLAQEFESRTYKFKYAVEKKVYLLEDFGHRNINLEVKSFPDDQVLAGGIVFSKQGLYLGCLGYSMGQVLPSFIPDTYRGLQGEETQEEAPPLEEQEQNEIVATAPSDNVKFPSMDENENKDLLEKSSEVENTMEEELNSESVVSNEQETETSSNQGKEEEISDVPQKEYLENNQTQEINDMENLKQESENSELMSENKLMENLENNPNISEMKDIKRDSSDLEFAISAEHNVKETSEQNDNGDEESNDSPNPEEETDRQGDITSEVEVTDEKSVDKTQYELEEVANSNQIEENNTIACINDKDNTTEEDSDRKEEMHSDTEVKEESECEPELEPPDVEKTIVQENLEYKSGTIADNTQETTHEDLKEDYNINTDQSSLINNNAIDNSDVAMETQQDPDIRESYEDRIPIEESKVPAEVTQSEDVQNEPVILEGSDYTSETDANLNDDKIKCEDPNKIMTEADEKDPNQNDSSPQVCKSEEDSSVGQVQLVCAVETQDKLLNTESSHAQLDEPTESQEHQNEEIQKESIEGINEVVNNQDSSEQENNTEKEESEEVLEQPIDFDNHPENDLMNEVEALHEHKPVEPDLPDGLQMELTKGVMELEKPVTQEAGDPLEPDDLLSTKVTENPKVLEDLALLLDTEHQHGGVSSWHDLAELLAIPNEAYDHCMPFSKPSPTEDLMVFLANTKPQFTISDLKDSLRSISRGDAVHLIDRYIARTIISDETVIQGIIERDDIDLLGVLALKFDRGYQQNWKVLARQLEVPSRILRNFGSHQRQNNSLLMLKYLPIFDPDLTIDSLKDSCKAVGLLEAVKFLDASGVPGEGAIMDILEDTDVIDELTDILNEEDQDGPNWKKLGRKLRIPEEKFSIFEPSKQNSPTKMLLKSIAQCEPDITVDELILALVAMKRHDVIEMLGKHFRNSDIRSILEENNCMPPQPDTPREDEVDESTA